MAKLTNAQMNRVVGMLQTGVLSRAVERALSSSSAECYNFLSPFLNFLSVIYRLNRNEVFYLLSSSDVSYRDCVVIYKAFTFAASPKIEC